jgi:hypothetical protein
MSGHGTQPESIVEYAARIHPDDSLPPVPAEVCRANAAFVAARLVERLGGAAGRSGS